MAESIGQIDRHARERFRRRSSEQRAREVWHSAHEGSGAESTPACPATRRPVPTWPRQMLAIPRA